MRRADGRIILGGSTRQRDQEILRGQLHQVAGQPSVLCDDAARTLQRTAQTVDRNLTNVLFDHEGIAVTRGAEQTLVHLAIVDVHGTRIQQQVLHRIGSHTGTDSHSLTLNKRLPPEADVELNPPPEDVRIRVLNLSVHAEKETEARPTFICGKELPVQ